MRAASDAAAIVSLPRSRRASASARPRSRSARDASSGESASRALISVGRHLPLAGGELHVDLEARPRRMGLVDEVAGRQVEPLGDVVEGDHRRSRDARLEGADVRLGVAITGDLLLGEPGTVAGLANPLTDAMRELAVALGGSGGRLRPRHGEQSTPGWQASFDRRLTRSYCPNHFNRDRRVIVRRRARRDGARAQLPGGRGGRFQSRRVRCVRSESCAPSWSPARQRR